MFTLFVEGGWAFMTVLTVLLAAIFFAAWKAPRWVKEIGSFALAFGFLSLCMGYYQAFHFISTADSSVAPNIIFGGMAVGLIPMIYGIIIYLVSLVVRLLQKPRL